MSRIAYFSAEYSVADSLPIYAGGLGILAGDIVQQAGSEGREFNAYGMVYYQSFTAGDPDRREMPERLEAEGFTIVSKNDEVLIILVSVEGRPVKVKAWRKAFGSASLTLFDTHVTGNTPETCAITNHLYDGEPGMMLRQELVLALASVALMEEEGFVPDFYHLNEGHMAFVGLAAALASRAAEPESGLAAAFTKLKPRIVAMKHTILPVAGLNLEPDVLRGALGPNLLSPNDDMTAIMALGGKPDGQFSGTRAILAMAVRSSGVSEIHVRTEAKAHVGSPLVTTTNGVYAPRWRGGGLPEGLCGQELRTAHDANRHELIDHVREATGQSLACDRLTVVWARRMTAYKRPELLVSDLERLATLANNAARPVQFIVSGKANPADATGLGLMNQVIEAAKRPELSEHLAYLPNFNPASARLLVQGADVWLNTPIRGMEACGTSGMKASLNGALPFSTSDGWIDEVDTAPMGWILPEDATSTTLYDILEQQIAPAFYNDASSWTTRMERAIELIEARFTAKSMLKAYDAKLYA